MSHSHGVSPCRPVSPGLFPTPWLPDVFEAGIVRGLGFLVAPLAWAVCFLFLGLL